jgi:nitrate/TMAO reductase-like tetraheme cytochrome c subunit
MMPSRRIDHRTAVWAFAGILGVVVPAALAQTNADCLECHGDKSLTAERRGRTVSLYIDKTVVDKSVHGAADCVSCHVDLEGKDLPHDAPLRNAQCGGCHEAEQKLYEECRHGKAVARGDSLAPRCQDCHGTHAITPVADSKSAVAPLRVPFVCGRCHKEGSPVQLQREIPQDRILENYSESIHGEGLLKKGLIVSATCASCHTPHRILPHTDPRSTIARQNIARTCAACHAQIEEVHRKVIKGELWEKEASVLPACVDCHQPHKIRKVFYDQGMADRDCLVCHEKAGLAAKDGRPMAVNAAELLQSRHAKTACSQCHTGVRPSLDRPCAPITAKVDCSSCHAGIVEEYQHSTHGLLASRQDPNGPTCLECHGKHGTRGKLDPQSSTFPINVPMLCARCHREGEKAAVRYEGAQHDITRNYTESIHGKGLLESGLVVTAMCSDCHSAHGELPAKDPASTVNRQNIASTCGRCHHGIEDQFARSIHARKEGASDKPLPICSDCHSAHTIRRTDADGFRLEIMDQCGRCHTDIAKTYFETYHGKVSQLGYAKTAKCYDCHSAHDIQPVADARSPLSRENVVATCRKCHPGATRRFAGYLTHATHHDPSKYPLLFWTFWGMTGLVIGTFVLSGLHTAFWLPRALKMRRERKKRIAAISAEGSGEGGTSKDGLGTPPAEGGSEHD